MHDWPHIDEPAPLLMAIRPKDMEDTDTATDRLHHRVRTAPSRCWRRTALAVPPLAVLACALFGAIISLSNSHTHHESQACHWMPLPWTIWATSYGGLLAALGAVVLWIALWWYARARGWDLDATWQGRLASGFAMLGGLAVLVLAGAVVLTHLESAEITARLGQPMCEGFGLQMP
ncbi:hypothetical protein OG417_34070 [Actinoallomurus sp. NBC_01490]|uniref:hypothetical protein n=1 Tax=Actinoallomurus sp. NBC_01490 TaxID=2903557 RepID=UPI002E331CFF|nr:hypothetical protein [Actinoallomurus sp. NBC_01490]